VAAVQNEPTEHANGMVYELRNRHIVVSEKLAYTSSLSRSFQGF
jgi:hypothetical protein